MGLWSTKSIAALQADGTAGGGEPTLNRVLGTANLTSLGVGATIGAGIFVVTGTAAAQYAGPAVVLSFFIAAIGCLCAGLCYAEFAGMVPVTGSAYTYTHASFGELAAWIVGWDLLIEYLSGAAAVAVNWSGYFVAFLRGVGVNLPASLTHAPFAAAGGWQVSRAPYGVVDLPAIVLVVILTAILATGIKASTAVNNVIVFVKVAIVLLVIVFGFMYVRPENWRPFIPSSSDGVHGYGWSGVLRAVGIVFPALIGFDAVSTASQEARYPHRDVPIAMLASIVICATLYILVALVVTGLTSYPELNAPHPMVVALAAAGPALHWLAPLIDVAAIAGLASVVLVLLLAQPRILFAMSRDGLLPGALSRVHPKFRTPYVATIVTGVIASVLAGFFPIELLWDLAILGALLAFAIVCAGVLALRYRSPNLMRPFRAPLAPAVPVLGILFSVGMMASLSADTWIRLAVWMAIGLTIYFFYGARSSRSSRSAVLPGD